MIVGAYQFKVTGNIEHITQNGNAVINRVSQIGSKYESQIKSIENTVDDGSDKLRTF